MTENSRCLLGGWENVICAMRKQNLIGKRSNPALEPPLHQHRNVETDKLAEKGRKGTRNRAVSRTNVEIAHYGRIPSGEQFPELGLRTEMKFATILQRH